MLSKNSDAERARAEMADVENISRQALVDVQQTILGDRSETLEEELERASSTLRTAGHRGGLPARAPDRRCGSRERAGLRASRSGDEHRAPLAGQHVPHPPAAERAGVPAGSAGRWSRLRRRTQAEGRPERGAKACAACANAWKRSAVRCVVTCPRARGCRFGCRRRW